MPPAYLLHGSGRIALEGDPKVPQLKSDLKAMLCIMFSSFLDPMLAPFGVRFGSLFGTPFGVNIDPRSTHDALPSLIFFKNTMFTNSV